MRPRYLRLKIVIAVLLLALLGATAVLAQGGTVHVVRPGETLSTIARLYGVSPAAIADANNLLNPSLIFAGQRLTIPQVGPVDGSTHVVRPGETLTSIARRYDVDPAQLAAANGLWDPNRIFVGQVLRIPGPRPTTPAPTPRPTALVPTPIPPRPTPAPMPTGCLCEEIVIFGPTRGMTVTSPVTVTGLGSGFEQTIIVTILDGSGGRIGQTPTTVSGPYGSQGVFTATVPFAVPADSQPGRIQVWSESPRDGAIEHLASMTVMLQGLDLDPLLASLDAAIRAKDYATLQGMMGDPFQLNTGAADSVSLSPAQASAQLRQTYLEPGAPRLDFSVDGRQRLGDRVKLASGIVHVVYGAGWGAQKTGDAFLLIGNVGGRARWVGLVYVPK
ncbi:MAG: LysM peptidoglycan-binding domain-containing protein [Chloroflexi bacterium]|nr:LysM peptidoglycan-binding domain-containing protein [Chloroflexota bacterium]